MEALENDFSNAKNFLVHLFRSEIANSPLIYNFFEEEEIRWMDDIDLACSMVIKTIKMSTEEDDFDFLPLYKENDDGFVAPNLILLDAYKERLEFPDLKKMALEKYNAYKPDAFIVEAKAAGLPLIFELRQTGIPVQEYTPSRGNDKVTRVHSVSPLFEAGMVWAPDETFADEMIEEVAAFPNGEYDDLVDSMTQALMRYRQGNFVQLPTDDWEDDENHVKVKAYY